MWRTKVYSYLCLQRSRLYWMNQNKRNRRPFPFLLLLWRQKVDVLLNILINDYAWSGVDTLRINVTNILAYIITCIDKKSIRFVCLRSNQNFNTKHLDLWKLHQNYKTSFSIDGPLPLFFVFGNWTLNPSIKSK